MKAKRPRIRKYAKVSTEPAEILDHIYKATHTPYVYNPEPSNETGIIKGTWIIENGSVVSK